MKPRYLSALKWLAVFTLVVLPALCAIGFPLLAIFNYIEGQKIGDPLPILGSSLLLSPLAS
jgi:hypothetical protein